ncbi:MAG: hypothetical protein KKB03_02605 [Nanoarchaeota archaeon]|nr:hypothetical protein [Nanoarchaeota archaeon]MBU1135105.1 hypothetical protein [Nanoarchaeota archaeon]MBU2520109.1 hypothetical protein [Nanoarchaeota archaeon]
MVDVIYIVAILLAVVFLEYVKVRDAMNISWKLLIITALILFLSGTFEFAVWAGLGMGEIMLWGSYILQLAAWVMLLITTIVGALELFGIIKTGSV